MSYDRTVRVHTDFAATVATVREALAAQGFGVLTEIDVTATLRAKLGEEMEDYLILGACNPPLAHRALGVDRSIGLLLPCNVVVRRDGDGTLVQAIDPATMVTFTGLDALRPVADEAATRLDAALAAVVEAAGDAQ
ncbi:DUF302 domain-containing protein [Yinghuangia soli]|uniref:DUF302 domain-containing protein n=1 Tax=Yinghuangia soli TaxID=2908204 RepID=A0AA41U255_9ACTN|nr:DUF302 domain-containing protein [Yinghuangia soli]MCF2530325.1 DUF302 domain-containing protein [Yinghuangia soli]